MSARTNSAYRLNTLLAKIPSIADGTRVYEGWAQLLGVKNDDALLVSRPVAEHLLWIGKELDLLEAQMKIQGISERLYQEPIRAVRAATSPFYLSAEWIQIKRTVKERVFVAFDHWSEMLPSDGMPVTDEQILQLYDLVDRLWGSLSNSPPLPPQLEAMIRHHVEMIHIALSKYPITGGKAFREAEYAGTGEMFANEEIIVAHKADEPVAILGKVWDKVVEVAETASKFEKVARLGQHIHDLLS